MLEIIRNQLAFRGRAVVAVVACMASSAAVAVSCDSNIAPSNPDSVYTVHGDGTATDIRTGLMWKVCSEGQTWSAGSCTGTAVAKTWANALIDAEAHLFAGQTDWRLPNMKELRSLVEECALLPAINSTVFPQTPGSYFWSGSPANYDSRFAWFVYFTGGAASAIGRTALNQVRLVRGGQSFGNLVTGVCGTANGVAVATAPTANLCAAGTANPATLNGPGPWAWTCAGANGGTTASCGAPVDTACASSTVATIEFLNLSASMTANAVLNLGAGALRTTFNVTCANGRFGVVRLPKTVASLISGDAYALVQSSCASKPVQRMANPAATAATVAAALGKKSSQVDLLSDALVGPLAGWVCE